MKKPGMVNDVWRVEPDVPQKQAPVRPAPTPSPIDSRFSDDIDQDTARKKSSTIELKNYGGIKVDNVSNATEAAAMILQFCVEFAKQTEPLLLAYGIILVKLTPGKLDTPFYIQRADGWTLAIPEVTSREQGCLQLIQAVSRIKKDAFLGPKMDLYHIQPYIW